MAERVATKNPHRWLRWIAIALVVLAISVLVFRQEIAMLARFATILDAHANVYNFRHMDELLDTRRVAAGGDVLEFTRASYALPESFRYQDRMLDTQTFLEETVMTGLLILREDTIIFERYWHGHSPESHHLAWSVTKSFVSALFGIALEEGHVRNIAQPVTDYLPELKGSGYDGVTIKDVLQMSSGLRFNEDYADPFSDINWMGPVMAVGSLLDFATRLQREVPPGTRNHYVSVDTQVLGEILVRATGQTLADYASEKLWRPLGMEFDAFWLLDGTGMEWAFGGLNASLRDYARFGWLYLHGGRRGELQIVPEAWVHASVRPDAPHLMPGPNPRSTNILGYGYHWWTPSDPDGDFMALGIWGQRIYVYPKHRLVIVTNSVDPNYVRNDFENTEIAVALWRAIAADLNSSRWP